jgi:hypothetical protein
MNLKLLFKIYELRGVVISAKNQNRATGKPWKTVIERLYAYLEGAEPRTLRG